MFLALLGTVAAKKSPDCRVLSMSGGGSFGAFESGVLSRMVEDEPGLNYEYMLGISAGALNAGYLSLYPDDANGLRNAIQALKDLWVSTKNDDVWKPRLDPFGKDPSILSTEPLEELLDRVLLNRTVQRKVTIGTTNLATGAMARHDEDELANQPNLLMRASSAIPMVFPPVTVNGTQHVDGGNSANVLTVHGIDRCDLAWKAKGRIIPPTIQIDVIMAEQTIPQVTPEETVGWDLLQLASREFEIAKKQLFDHQLRFQCAPGVESRIHMTLRAPNGVIQKGKFLYPAILDFDNGEKIWGIGFNTSRISTTSFDFCL
jgi:hypothetical protein